MAQGPCNLAQDVGRFSFSVRRPALRRQPFHQIAAAVYACVSRIIRCEGTGHHPISTAKPTKHTRRARKREGGFERETEGNLLYTTNSHHDEQHSSSSSSSGGGGSSSKRNTDHCFLPMLSVSVYINVPAQVGDDIVPPLRAEDLLQPADVGVIQRRLARKKRINQQLNNRR